MYRLLQQKNRALREGAVQFVRDLIETPSPTLSEGRVAALVENKAQELGYDRVLRDDAGNVVAILHGRDAGPNVLLNAHMDTVEAERGQWQHPPLRAREHNGSLYGLGASDCKSGISAALFAGHLLKRALLPLKGNLVVAATVAEGNGRSVGIHAMLDETLPGLRIEPDYVLLAEPTELGLYYGHDGWVEFEVPVEGASLSEVRETASQIHGHLQSEARWAAGTGGVEEMRLGGIDFQSQGRQGRARIRMDRRLAASDRLNRCVRGLKRDVGAAGQSAGSVAIEVDVCEEQQTLYTGRTLKVKNVTNAWTTDPFSPVVEKSRQALAAAGSEARPGKWELNRLRMGTAGSVLTREYGVPTVGYGPGSEQAAHARDEWVEIERIPGAVYGLSVIVHKLIGMPVFGWSDIEM